MSFWRLIQFYLFCGLRPYALFYTETLSTPIRKISQKYKTTELKTNVQSFPTSIQASAKRPRYWNDQDFLRIPWQMLATERIGNNLSPTGSITMSPKSRRPRTQRKCMSRLPLLTLASFDHLVYYKEDKITWQFLTFPSLNNNLNNNETKLFLIILIWRTYLRHKNAEIHKRGLARMYLVVGWRIVNSSGHNIM